jgi:hypothetical protein
VLFRTEEEEIELAIIEIGQQTKRKKGEVSFTKRDNDSR